MEEGSNAFHGREPDWEVLHLVSRHFPNIKDVVLKHARYGPAFCQTPISSKLTRLELAHGTIILLPVVGGYTRRARHIAELIADGCIFQHSSDAFGSPNEDRARMRLKRELDNDFSNERADGDKFILMDFPSITHLSLKGAFWEICHGYIV